MTTITWAGRLRLEELPWEGGDKMCLHEPIPVERNRQCCVLCGACRTTSSNLVGPIEDSAHTYIIHLTGVRQADGSYVLAGKPEPLAWAEWKLPEDEG